MNKANWIALLALLAFVISLPLYGMREPQRMLAAQQAMRGNFLAKGIDLYLQNCAQCHGTGGEGYGKMPALNRPALAQAQTERLIDAVARATHGSIMAAWHVEEGGLLTDYQVEQIVTVIQYGNWVDVKKIATQREIPDPYIPEIERGLAYMELEQELDPHRCVACHDEPAMHATLFGPNCARCHNSIAWKPAVLTRHDFHLDHGEMGDVDCETCHPGSYIAYDCYGCHNDHQEFEMRAIHSETGLYNFGDCAACHPTGVADDVALWNQTGFEADAVKADEVIVNPASSQKRLQQK